MTITPHLMKLSVYVREAQGNKPRDPNRNRWNCHVWILSLHWTRGKYSSHLHMKHDFLVPPALRQATIPHKSMNFPFHLCREITEKHMGDPLKTSGAKCITAKEFTISLWTRDLPIAYQEEIYFTVSSSLPENTGHLKPSQHFPLLFTATY